ncbi:MAG: acetyl-CoA C-acyltransferase [Bacteroidia bacterium]|nr:acetyl-CoA C-acyltransferase [Bacteroidia bacterium]
MKDVFIYDACRTPIGKHGGSLSSVRPDDLLALVLRALVQRNPNLPLDLLEDVYAGDANQSGEDNRNVARMALLLADLPITSGGVTLNRLCASGLEAVSAAYRAVACGEGDLFFAGGVESMTRAPYVLSKSETPFGRNSMLFDTTIGWRFTNPELAKRFYPYSMGETAENLAEKYQISRTAQDEFAYHSQLKYQQAHQTGKFDAEIIPVLIPQKKGNPISFDKDEHPRLATVEQLAALQPAFKKGGTVTAGNSSGINDGSAALVIGSEQLYKEFGMKPLARFVTAAVSGVSPDIMGIGPVPATQKALKRAGISAADLDLVELNEAFAVQSLACLQELNIDSQKVNVNGGAIALGHPLGCSGARIIGTLAHELHRNPNFLYGLATLCVGVGQGQSVILERV